MTQDRMTSLMWSKREVCEVRTLLTNTLYQPHLTWKDVFPNFLFFPCTQWPHVISQTVVLHTFFIFWTKPTQKNPAFMVEMICPLIALWAWWTFAFLTFSAGVWFASLACVRDDKFTTPYVCTDSDTALWWHVNTCATLTGTAWWALAATQVSMLCKLPRSRCPAVLFPGSQDSAIVEEQTDVEGCVAAVANAVSPLTCSYVSAVCWSGERGWFCCHDAVSVACFSTKRPSSHWERGPRRACSSGAHTNYAKVFKWTRLTVRCFKLDWLSPLSLFWGYYTVVLV